MDQSRSQRGSAAENQAAQHLLGLGYTLITRNYRVPGGEVDLIALDQEVLVFVEVRMRAAGNAEWTIGAHKVEAMRRAARRYLRDMDESREHRFDLIAIDPEGLHHHHDFLRG